MLEVIVLNRCEIGNGVSNSEEGNMQSWERETGTRKEKGSK